MKHRFVWCGAALLTVACLSASESAGQTADRKKSAAQTAPSASEQPPAGNLQSGFASTNPETRLQSGFASANPETRQRVVQEYCKLPLSFEANQGQVDGRVKFLSRGPGYQLSLLPDRAVLTIRERFNAKPIAKKFGVFHTSAELREREAVQYETLSMALVGAARDAQVNGVEEMPGKSNYFLGNDPAR